MLRALFDDLPVRRPALEWLDLPAVATGADARDLPVPAPLVRFPHRIHLGGDAYVNARDAPARLSPAQPWHVLHRWGKRLGDADVRAHAVSRARAGGRTAPAAEPEPTWPAREEWLPRVPVLVARERAGSSRGLTMAVKAGHNGERHNHLDVGSYWVAVDVVAHAGQPTYTASSFGPDRYRAWPLRGEWHNVPEPGVTQEPGAASRARDVRFEPTAAGAALSADLAGAYPGVPRWIRSVRLERVR
ncbi:hypothetical protein [Amycolatopsis rifamycinica]|uniref:Uncharacterized protein n=1 Tax=Amycolatopsis rifamycinica TaxID=287986 RepID=A0A066TZR0_9PSEU|nr:hypothetical protein [Amycolatopsis rifamycinica]KDN19087.1 hypothetical protein DV20_27190 [Amycolatopsis rifamycinica]